MRLTEAQIKHLRALKDSGRRSAYPRLHFNTLKALTDRWLVKADYGTLGAFFEPRTSIMFEITEAGRLALAEAERGRK